MYRMGVRVAGVCCTIAALLFGTSAVAMAAPNQGGSASNFGGDGVRANVKLLSDINWGSITSEAFEDGLSGGGIVNFNSWEIDPNIAETASSSFQLGRCAAKTSPHYIEQWLNATDGIFHCSWTNTAYSPGTTVALRASEDPSFLCGISTCWLFYFNGTSYDSVSSGASQNMQDVEILSPFKNGSSGGSVATSKPSDTTYGGGSTTWQRLSDSTGNWTDVTGGSCFHTSSDWSFSPNCLGPTVEISS